MTVYLLRHGETEYNITKQYTGTLDIPVSAEGMKKIYNAGFDAHHVYISPLCRTKQTAELLFPTAEYLEIEDFKEMCFGELEGKFYDLSTDKSGAGFAAAAAGGETREQFCLRTCAAFEDLIDKELSKGSDYVIIVAHGGTQMAVLSTFVDDKRPYEAWCSKNAGGYVLEIRPEKWQKEKRLSVLREVNFAKTN